MLQDDLRIRTDVPPRDVVRFCAAPVVVDENFSLLNYRIVGKYKARRESIFEWYHVISPLLTARRALRTFIRGGIFFVQCGECHTQKTYEHIEDVPLIDVPCCPGHNLIAYEDQLEFGV